MIAALERAHLDGHKTSPATLALDWLQCDRRARVIVDETLKLIWSNPAAEEWLARREDVECSDGYFGCVNPLAGQALMDWLPGCGSSLNSYCLSREDGDGHVLFRAQEIGWFNGIRYFGVGFHDDTGAASVRYADLDTVFRLTKAEHRVLLRLLDGSRATAIARELGVSIETIRVHIRKIYAKLGVTSREGMCSRVRPHSL